MSPLIFDSVEHMLGPEQLGCLLGHRIITVERGPLYADHFSGNVLEHLLIHHEDGVASLVLKSFDQERDWVMRLTHDLQTREVTLFREGIYDQLPRRCHVPIMAAGRQARGWTTLMRDVRETLFPASPHPVSLPALKVLLRHLAAIHVRFLGTETLRAPALGLCSLEDFLLILSPDRVRTELAHGRSHPVLDAAQWGWNVLETVASADTRAILANIFQDVRPLLRALGEMPQTLIHGDFKLANLGQMMPPDIEADPVEGATVFLDWQEAAYAPPLLDLGYFLIIDAFRLPISADEVLELYREALAQQNYIYPMDTWERDVDLGLLAGGAMRVLWQKALQLQMSEAPLNQRAHQALDWWLERIVRAARWLS